MHSTRVLTSIMLGSAVAGFTTLGIANVPAEQPSSPAKLLDPAYVAQQVCGPTKPKSEFFNPGFQDRGDTGGVPNVRRRSWAASV